MAAKLLLQRLKLMIARRQFRVVSSMFCGSEISELYLRWPFTFWQLLFGSVANAISQYRVCSSFVNSGFLYEQRLCVGLMCGVNFNNFLVIALGRRWFLNSTFLYIFMPVCW